MHMSTTARPVYQVQAPRAGARIPLHTSRNFLDASDFAFDYIAEHDPAELAVVLLQDDGEETLWTYSRDRTVSETESRRELVDIFGYPVGRWPVPPNLTRRWVR
jgi:hypothetical protein